MSLDKFKAVSLKDKLSSLEKEEEAVVEEIVAVKKAKKRAKKD